MKKLLICIVLAILCFRPAAAFAAQCDPGFVKCRDVCVDLLNDPNNCGDCDVVCPSGECSGGLCTSVPPPTNVWTYDLARLLTGEGYSTNNYDFGTFTVTDIDDGDLRITVTLNPESIYVFEETHVKTIAFNYVEGSALSTYTFTVNLAPGTTLNDEDNVMLGGYPTKFDLLVPESGRILPRYTQDYQFEMVLSAVNADGINVDLDPQDLLYPIEGNEVLVGLQLGGLETLIDDSDSAWIPFLDDDNTASPI